MLDNGTYDMILLTLTEGDGITTHLSIGVDPIAVKMGDFFENVIGLEVEYDKIDSVYLPTVRNQEESQRAEYLIREWRKYDSHLMVVK